MMAKTVTKVSIAAVAAVAAYLAVGAFFAHADQAPTITTTIRDSSVAENIITSALIGSSVHDVVQIASSTNQTLPQGTVNFNVYNNTSCANATSSSQNGTALVNGFATSSPVVVGASGLSFQVHYNGDTGNVAANGPCEPLTVTSNTATIATALSAGTITAGATAHDTATLSNETGNAGGTVTYTVYSDASCQTPFSGAGVVNVANGAVPNSNEVPFPAAGTYFWQAVYHGDANNNIATSTCGSENLTVQAVQSKNSPTISTTLSTTSSTVLTGSTIHDSATLSGETGTAGGTVTYKVFTNNACTALFASLGTKAVTNGVVTDSDPITLNSVGTYYFQAVYGGDANNNPATSTCSAEVLTVANSGTPVTSNSLSGEVYNDLNGNGVKDSGEVGLAGFTINLYNSANFNGGAYDPVFKTTTTDASGNYSFSALSDGTYSVEQLKKTGWNQDTDDYSSVTVSGGIGKSALDFGDTTNTIGNGNCDFSFKTKFNNFFLGGHNNGKHNGCNPMKHGRCDGNGDMDDANCTSTSTTATSTPPHGHHGFDGDDDHHVSTTTDNGDSHSQGSSDNNGDNHNGNKWNSDASSNTDVGVAPVVTDTHSRGDNGGRGNGRHGRGN